jgi:hypothetical protein
MKQLVLKSILILTLFIPVILKAYGMEASPSETTQPAVWEMPVRMQATETIYVEWDIQAYGHEDYWESNSRFVNHREIKIAGEAVVHKPPSGDVTTIPMKLAITDDSYRQTTTICPPGQDVAQSENHERKSITDPGRYNGGPDFIWSGNVFDMYLTPAMRVDGSWYMSNPFFWGVFATGWSGAGFIDRDFNYHSNTKSIPCLGSSSNTSYDEESSDYDYILYALADKTLEGDQTGKIFTLNTHYMVEGVPDLTVRFNATVRIGGGCKYLPAPIDISSPAITAWS